MSKTKRINQTIVYTTLSATCFLMLSAMVTPFIGPYLVSHGFSRSDISFIASLAPLAIIFVAPIMGSLSDYLGRKFIQVISLIIYLVALILYLFVDHSFITLVIATTVSTLFLEVYMETVQERTQDNLTPSIRNRYTGVIESIKTIGSLAGSLVATYIVYNSPFQNVLKIALVILILLITAGFITRTGMQKRPKKKKILNPFKNLRAYLKLDGVGDFTILNAAASFHHPAVIMFIPLFITQELHGNLWLVGLYSSSMILGFLLEFLGGFACDVFGVGRTALLSLTVNSITFILVAIARTPIEVVIIGFFMGLSSAFWSASSTCRISEVGEKHKKEGMVVGSFASLAYLSVFISFIVSGYLIDTIGVRLLLILYGSIGLLTILFVYYRIRNKAYFRR